MTRCLAHAVLALCYAALAVLCVPLARLGLTRPLLWALDAHERHYRRAFEIIRNRL